MMYIFNLIFVELQDLLLFFYKLKKNKEMNDYLFIPTHVFSESFVVVAIETVWSRCLSVSLWCQKEKNSLTLLFFLYGFVLLFLNIVHY